MKFLILWLCAMALGAMAIPTVNDYRIHEHRDSVPDVWTKGNKLDGKTALPVRIGLTQSNLDHGHDLLMELSDPTSTRYGKYLSSSEAHELFAPSQKSVDDVTAWLVSSGISRNRISQSVNKQWIQFDASADELEDLLRTEYHVYSHSETGRSHVACREYHVPASLSDHIDYITPGISLREVIGVRKSGDKLGKRSINSLPPIIEPILVPIQELLMNNLSLCSLALTPQCIQEMYNITKGHSATKGNELGIFESLGDVYLQEDLDLFFSTFYKDIPTGTHPTLKSVDGGQAPNTNLSNPGLESALDFDIAYPIIWPQNTLLFQSDDMVYENNYVFTGFLNTFLDSIDGSYCSEISPLDPSYPDNNDGGYKGALQCGVYEPPNVISISYGSLEAFIPVAYQRRQCAEFMKLGAMGVSVVISSGDSGVGPGGNVTNCLGSDHRVFTPDFPANCPYLTAVGGTQMPIGAWPYEHKEQAVTRYGSGGGFSNIFEIPDYQAQAVAHYFATANPPYKYYESVNNTGLGANGGIYNRKGRGFPDVAAAGDKVIIFGGGAPMSIGGTSASAPLFAAILTRINEERLAAGKPTVGFVNPVLYAHPEAFFDVTEGNNPGCGSHGFSAAPGWDPVTGLGTPNYPALLDAFMST